MRLSMKKLVSYKLPDVVLEELGFPRFERKLKIIVASAHALVHGDPVERKTNMNANEITSTVISNHIQAGGRAERLEIVAEGDNDHRVVALTFEGRDGTYLCDNAGVTWVDADIDRVVEAFRDGTVDELPEAKGVSEI